MSIVDVVVIGGGAAGFFAAITCAEANPNARVMILERNANVLGKVRISGGGRCNVTHACFDPAELVQHYPRGSLALRGPLTRFGPRETVAWFAARGVALKAEADGRMFPTSDDSATIVDCLIHAARDAGVTIRTKVETVNVKRKTSNVKRDEDEGGEGFEVELRDGETIECDSVLLATGSSAQGWRWAQALGHTIVPPVPSLFTFESRDARLADLAGVAIERAQVRLPDWNLNQTGPLLITHWGFSGPAVLKLSAWAARELHGCGYRADLEINWLPDMREDELTAQLHALKQARGGQIVGAHSPFAVLPLRLWKKLVAAAGIFDEQRWAKLPRANQAALAAELHCGRYRIEGKGQFKDEFVTCGGVRLDEIHFRTMESRACPGLYLTGEILDIDGVTGGFNFQSAWTTGWLAGLALSAL